MYKKIIQLVEHFIVQEGANLISLQEFTVGKEAKEES